MIADGFKKESSAFCIYAKRLVYEMPRKGDCIPLIFTLPLQREIYLFSKI